jgi:hypothetical protein
MVLLSDELTGMILNSVPAASEPFIPAIPSFASNPLRPPGAIVGGRPCLEAKAGHMRSRMKRTGIM